MDHLLFFGSITLIITIAIAVGAKILAREEWQFLAVVPGKKTARGGWHGLNLTYYGVLSANAYTFAVAVFLVLSRSAGLPVAGLCLLVFCLLAVCLPASKGVARMVEKKRGTLTVGGAVFVGTLAAPWLVFLVNQTLGRVQGFHIPVPLFLAAVSIAYAYGEGLGRLACISFGCCYGRTLDQCGPLCQRLFSRVCLVFHGETKKIAYGSGLEGRPVLPVQVITAILYSAAALTGTWLFLGGHYLAALMTPLCTTQLWRFFSEFLRADFRGSLAVTPYQIMALFTIVYAAAAALLFSGEGAALPVLLQGIQSLWDPGIILFLQAIWVGTFLHTGRSQVTGSQISFHVKQDRI